MRGGVDPKRKPFWLDSLFVVVGIKRTMIRLMVFCKGCKMIMHPSE